MKDAQKKCWKKLCRKGFKKQECYLFILANIYVTNIQKLYLCDRHIYVIGFVYKVEVFVDLVHVQEWGYIIIS